MRMVNLALVITANNQNIFKVRSVQQALNIEFIIHKICVVKSISQLYTYYLIHVMMIMKAN